jgi:hypothetical protein
MRFSALSIYPLDYSVREHYLPEPKIGDVLFTTIYDPIELTCSNQYAETRIVKLTRSYIWNDIGEKFCRDTGRGNLQTTNHIPKMAFYSLDNYEEFKLALKLKRKVEDLLSNIHNFGATKISKLILKLEQICN